MSEKNDFDLLEYMFKVCIGWRKLFEQAQDILREIRKKELLPEDLDLYLKLCRICEIEELPKRYMKGVKHG